MLAITFILIIKTLVSGVGPVETRTDYPDLQSCLAAKAAKTMEAGDRMMHGECKEKQ